MEINTCLVKCFFCIIDALGIRISIISTPVSLSVIKNHHNSSCNSHLENENMFCKADYPEGSIFDRKGTAFITLSTEKWYPLQIKINITSLELCIPSNYGKLQLSQHELFHLNRHIALVGIQHTISQRQVNYDFFIHYRGAWKNDCNRFWGRIREKY